MPDSPAPLIETAVRPLADDAEMKLAASHLLSELIENREDGTEEAIQRWDAADAKKRKPVWRLALYLILGIVSTAALWREAKSITGFRAAYAVVGIYSAKPGASLGRAGKASLTSDEKLLLYGDDSKHSQADKAKTLWDRYPENPAYFLDYAGAYLSDHGELPTDFLEVSHRIDPRNAWLVYLAASVEAKDCVKKRKQSSAAKAAHEAPERDIVDQARFDRAAALIHQARDLPLCNDYKAKLIGQKIALLRQGDQAERQISFAYLGGMTEPGIINIRWIGEILATKAAMLAHEKNVPEFQSLMEDSETFARKMLSIPPSTLVSGLVCRVSILTSLQGMAAGARELGLLRDAERFQPAYDAIYQSRETYKKRELRIDGMEFQRKSGYMAGLITPLVSRQVANPPAITDADVKPGRMIDHEEASMVCAVGAFLLLGVCLAFVWAFRFRQGKLIRRLGLRVEELLCPVDWAWVMGVGNVLPVLLVMGLNRFTPLGGRDFSILGMNYILPTGHFLALLFLLLIVPILVARWRLGKRASFLGCVWKSTWLGWAAVISTTIYVIAIGLVMPPKSMATILLVTVFLLLPKLWLLAVGTRAIYAKPAQILMSATVARVLVPVYAGGLLLMILLLPVFKAAEQYWFERDKFMQLNPAQLGMTTYEYKVAVQLQKETREILGYDR